MRLVVLTHRDRGPVGRRLFPAPLRRTPLHQEPKRSPPAARSRPSSPIRSCEIKVSDTEDCGLSKSSRTKPRSKSPAPPNRVSAHGLTVRFEGEIDKKGTLQAEITELEIFTPQGKNALGLLA